MIPSVSVVIPTHDRLRFLPEALESVRRQSFRPREVLLVDDASADGTAAWAARQRLPGLRVIRLRRNQGAAAARRRAVAEARGGLIALLDSDDAWKPGYLAALAPRFRDPSVVVAFSNVDLVDEAGRVVERRAMRFGPRPCTPTVSAAILRRESVLRAGSFDAGYRRLFDDADLFARLVLRHGTASFLWIDRALARRRLHGAQLTTPLNAAAGAGAAACAAGDIQILLDLIRLGRAHEGWLAPLLPPGRRFPSETYGWGSWSVFAMAYRLARRRERGGRAGMDNSASKVYHTGA